ncbi:MAG: hypothetical protein AB8B86_14820 [Pseudomonadales bacterium]
MSKTKQTESEIHAKALEDFFKRGGKIEHIENGKSGQTYKSASQTVTNTPAAATPTTPAKNTP